MLGQLKGLKLLHSLQAFPADVPFAILGEAGVVGNGAAIPAGTHHGDGDEETAIAWKIEAQAIGGLEVMAVLQIGVLLLLAE